MYELNRIRYEAHERTARREAEAAAERSARLGRTDSRRRRLRKASKALRHLPSYGHEESLEAEI
jgi:hypothetical protein